MNCRRKILTVMGIALAAAILIPIIHHYQLRAATEAYIAELKARGEPMDLAQVIPPRVSPEQNGTEIFRKAARLLDADKTFLDANSIDAMDLVVPGKAMICSQQPVVLQTYSTNSWEALIAAVGQNKEALELLLQIIERPALDFQIHYERGLGDSFDFTNLNLVQLKRSAKYLSAAAVHDLHHGGVPSAVAKARTMLVLANTMQNQRLVISELVRIAIAQRAVNLNWEILQAPGGTDGQLAELQNAWAGLNFIQGNKDALALERATGKITLENWRGSPAELEKYFDWGGKMRENIGLADQATSVLTTAKRKSKIFLWRNWWSYADELRSLKGFETLMETARFAETNGSFQTALHNQEAGLDALGIGRLNSELESVLFPSQTDFHSILSESIVTLGHAFRKVMAIESAKRVVITAIALKRYQLKHGECPAHLNSLAPEFLPAVPLDPVDGQPLRYRRNADGTFLLYSVGENGKDDGGDPSLEKGVESSSFNWLHPRALDWVWPQPASPGEVQAYYARPAKN
jgi:hypothetical protein